MSYNFFGDQHDQPWPSHWSRQNNLANAPFSFNNRKYYSDYFAVNNRCEPLIPRHHHRPSNDFTTPPSPPQPTTNMLTKQYIAMSGQSGSKAKFRFHGGIGDGLGGLACQISEENTSPRPLKLFDELSPIDMLIKAPKPGFVKNHVTRAPALPVEASSGTGVFFPAYPKKICSKKGMRGGNGGCWNEFRDVPEAKECADKKAILVERILPSETSEWPY